MRRIMLTIVVVSLILLTACSDSQPSTTTNPSSKPGQTTGEPTTTMSDNQPTGNNGTEDLGDVLDRAYQQGDILYQLGLFDGVSTTDYEPNLEGAMNREEAMKMIVSALGWEPSLPEECPFTDVSEWAKPFVGRAYLNGIAIGTVPQDNIFGAKDPVVLQHLLTFYLRALGYETTYAYENAIRLGNLKGLTDNVKFSVNFLSRYHLVLITYNALGTTKVNSARTLLEDLVSEGRVDQSMVQQLGLIKTYKYQSQRDDGPYELTENSFDDEILNEEKALVLFYQKGSDLSDSMLQPFMNTAIALADIAKVGKIEKDAAGDLLTEYNITSFPSLKLFKSGEATTLPAIPETDTLVQWVKNN
ncbi:MAG TPA: hypothetical protein DCG34_06485 [Clostridiales bacterium]|nr:hypothetical protein [Clostridiales bacterium]